MHAQTHDFALAIGFGIPNGDGITGGGSGGIGGGSSNIGAGSGD